MDNIMNEIEKIFPQITGNGVLEKIIVSFIILILVLIGLKIMNHFINGVFNENKKDLEPREKRRIVTLNHALKTAGKAGIITMGTLSILGQFIDVGSILAIAGVGTLAIGFGAQSLVEDVMSGFVIVFENQFSVGDYVTIDEKHYGIVEVIGIRTTSIREFDGGLFIIHNGKIDRLINFSKGHVRIFIDIGIAYEENIENAIETLNEICREVYENYKGLFTMLPEVMGVTELDSSSVNIRIVAEEDITVKFEAELLLRKRIKERFDEKGIEIPYNKSVIFMKKLEVE
jgi:small conductance mechanosensitive channel